MSGNCSGIVREMSSGHGKNTPVDDQGHDCKQTHLRCEQQLLRLRSISCRDINNHNISRSFDTHIVYHNHARD